MKTSRTRFVVIFLVLAFAFQVISNSLLGPEIRLFPTNGDYLPGTGSTVVWKNTLAAILFPVKIVLLGPLSFLFKLPDPPPPLLAIAFAVYWGCIALLIYYLLSKLNRRNKWS